MWAAAYAWVVKLAVAVAPVLMAVALPLPTFGAAVAPLPRPRVVLVCPSGIDLVARLRVEAAAAGVEMITDERARTDESPSLIARRNDAAGVLFILTAGSATLYRGAQGENSGRYETFEAAGADDPFALRLVEELRPRLLAFQAPLALAPEGGDAKVVVGAAAALTEAPRQQLMLLDGGGGVGGFTSSGGVSSSVHATITLRALFPSGWGAGLLGLFALTDGTLAAPEGAASVHSTVLAGEVNRRLWHHGVWFSSAGAGAGILRVDLRGRAADGYLAASETHATAVALANLDLAVALTDSVAVCASVRGGATTSRHLVRFDGREVGAAPGRIFAQAAVTLDFRMPITQARVHRP